MNESPSHPELFLQEIFTSLPMGVVALTTTFKLWQPNSAFCSLTGYQEEELCGLDCLALTHPDDWPILQNQLMQLIAGKISTIEGRYRFSHKKGHTISIKTKISLMSVTHGSSNYLVLMCDRNTWSYPTRSALYENQRDITLELAGWERFQKLSLDMIVEDHVEHLYDRILHAALAIMRADMATLQLLYPEQGDGGELQLVGALGFASDTVEAFRWVRPMKSYVCGEALRTGNRIVVEDIETCEFLDHYSQEVWRNATVRMVQATPLFSRSGRFLGIFSTYWRLAHRLATWEHRLCDMLTRQAADLIERTQGEALLKVSEERFRKVFFLAGSGIAITDLDGRIEQCNQVFCEMLGYTDKELLAIECPSLIHPEDRAANMVAIERLKAQAYPYFEIENRYLHKDGHPVYVQKFISIFPNIGAPPQLIVLATDITDRKKKEEHLQRFKEQLKVKVYQRTRKLMASQEQLRSLASQLSLAEERERRKLAKDLHDYLAQILVVGGMKLEYAKQLLSFPPQAEQVLQDIADILQQAMSYTRTTIAELSPPGFQETGFPAALQWLREIMQKHGLQVDISIGPEKIILSEDRAILLFQSVRELLFNVLKHAGVNRATVHMEKKPLDHVSLSVGDRGKGLDANVMRRKVEPGHLGLFGVSERMKAMGGQIEVQAMPGQGTTITLVLPLGEPRKLSRKRPTSSIWEYLAILLKF